MYERVILMTLLAFGAIAGEKVTWGYGGPTGPQHWGELSPEFALCSQGVNQSPIDLANLIEADLPALQIRYQPVGAEIVHNGHTIQINLEQGNQIEVDGRQFALLQFHAHTPSENLIDGQSFPLEIHFVHADDSGQLAVIGVMFQEGTANPALSEAWADLPQEFQSRSLPAPFAAETLFPEARDYYRFNGSLTTPPCSEGVLWMVLKQPVEASRQQIDAFLQAIGHTNNRPVQSTFARPVLQ